MGLTYDTRRGRAVLFGGRTFDDRLVAETWEWDGRRWRRRRPLRSPAARVVPALAYDDVRGRTVLFGGGSVDAGACADEGVNCSDTWTWDGMDWVRRVVSGPPGRQGAALAWDPQRRVLVLFGGRQALRYEEIYLADTWEWDGSQWHERVVAQAPPAREGHGLVWDPSHRALLLLGGKRGGGERLDDLWHWDGERWTEIVPDRRPAARSWPLLASDPQRGTVLLHGGGFRAAGDEEGERSWLDTWEWDGVRWKQRYPPTTPRPTEPGVMTFDPVRARPLLYAPTGQEGDEVGSLWEWDGQTWRRRSPPALPPGRIQSGLVADPEDGALLFGGSMASAVLPVWRSPMISSRWPRPIGVMASTALIPVCSGWLTLIRLTMPGALISTTRRSSVSIAPPPTLPRGPRPPRAGASSPSPRRSG